MDEIHNLGNLGLVLLRQLHFFLKMEKHNKSTFIMPKEGEAAMQRGALHSDYYEMTENPFVPLGFQCLICILFA